MSRKKRGLLFWLPIFIVAGGVVFLFLNMIQAGASSTDYVSFMFGALLPAFSFLYLLIEKHSLKFYILTSRLRSIFSYKAPSWNLSAQFMGENISREMIDTIVTKLVDNQNATNIIHVRKINIDTINLIIPKGPNVELRYHQPTISPLGEFDEPSPASIQLVINNYLVSYREASFALSHVILPLLEKIANILKASETRYSLVIEFEKAQNPFFGLYIAHLPPEAISKFMVNLNINEYGQKNTVLISESKISINTRSQNALQNLALEFLTFGPKLTEHLSSA